MSLSRKKKTMNSERQHAADALYLRMCRKAQREAPLAITAAQSALTPAEQTTLALQHCPLVERRGVSMQCRPMSLVLHESEQENDPTIVYRSTVAVARHYFDAHRRAITVRLSEKERAHEKELLLAYRGLRPCFEFWPFQREILRFMRQREYDREQIGCRGGMLSVDMGLGKALMMLQHILSDNQRCSRQSGRRWNGASLFVCEAILLQQLIDEMKDKWPERAFQYCCILTGDEKRLHRIYVEHYCDIVLTTYSTLKCVYKEFYANEMDLQQEDAITDEENDDEGEEEITESSLSEQEEQAQRPDERRRAVRERREYLREILYETQWKRIFADEAHVFVNPRTLINAAMLRLRSPIVWSVTGTPVRHWPDVCSTFRFIGVPAGRDDDEDEEWPEQHLSGRQIKKLRRLLGVVMVRLMKSDLVAMPERPLFPRLIKAIQLLEFENRCEKATYYMYAAYAMRNWRDLLEPLDEAALLEREDDRFQTDGRDEPKKQKKSTRANIAGVVQCMRQICINLKIVENLVLPAGTLTLQNAARLRLRKSDSESLFHRSKKQKKEEGHERSDHFSLSDLAATLIKKTTFLYEYERDLFESQEYYVLHRPPSSDDFVPLDSDDEMQALKRDHFTWDPLRQDDDFDLASRSDRHLYRALYEELTENPAVASHDRKERAMLQHLRERLLPGDYVSTKNRRVIDYICQAPLDDKIIVFSDLVEALKQLAVDLERLVGIGSCLMCGKTASTNSRQLAEFKREPTKRVLLLSLRLCNVGLNIVEANHILFLDEWWNPNTGEQAENRVQRIGQKKTVYILHFVMNRTLETHIINLLYKKRNISSEIVDKRPRPQEKLSAPKRRRLSGERHKREDEEQEERTTNLFDYSIVIQ